MKGWFLIQTFYHELKRTSHEHLDAAAGGAFFSLQVPATKELIEKIVANQGWDGDHLQPRTRDVHKVEGIDMIAAKMDLLMKKLEASTSMETAKIMDAHMTFEVCGNVGHSGIDCPETREEASFVDNSNNNGFATTTTTIKGGTRGPTSRSTIKMEVTILTPSIISLPLKILSLAKLELMKV
jgi:hypothetical protein